MKQRSWPASAHQSGYSCASCYHTFSAGRKAKAAADPKQIAITQFFKKQKQQGEEGEFFVGHC